MAPDAGSERLRAAIHAGTVLLDGGMGTRLRQFFDRGTPEFEEPSRANRTHPGVVRSIHARDFEAGADAVLTNTFGANRARLDGLGIGRQFEALNRVGVELAREAAGPDRFVIGSIGPDSADDADRKIREQAAILVEAGVDALILETQTFDQADRVLGHLSAIFAVPIFASLWTWPEDAAAAAKRLQDVGADAIGTNCGLGLDDVLAATEKIAGAVSVPLIAKPSADTRGKVASPETFARFVPQFLDLGVRLIGGCCGSGEGHIAAMRKVLNAQGESRRAGSWKPAH